MHSSYDTLLVGYPWNATYITDYDYDGQTSISDVIVNFTSDGSINNVGFLIEFYSGKEQRTVPVQRYNERS